MYHHCRYYRYRSKYENENTEMGKQSGYTHTE